MSLPDDRVWYHLIFTLYGAWLHGDSRGFRTRHHREHVEGDYKRPPPPGKYAARERHSRASLKRAPVVLPPRLRPILAAALREHFEGLGAMVLCVSVGGQHVHILAKLPRDMARKWSGIAKVHAWHALRGHGWPGKLWARRSKAILVRDREHQLNVYHYILIHAEEGAWVWKWGGGREGSA